MEHGKLEISGITIDKITNEGLQKIIENSIEHKETAFITYANVNTINCTYNNLKLKDVLNSFDVIHPDGIGIYLASKFLHCANGFKKRVTGSDFYPILIDEATHHNWSIFFFGHDDKTLHKIPLAYPQLNICGAQNGYDYDSDIVLQKINNMNPDILIVGLSFPLQEKWLLEQRHKLNCKIALCVGDGIKVFAGSKIRGPKIFRALGLEWLMRLLGNPIIYFKRYIIGIPLFLGRIIIIKLLKFRE